MEKVNNTRIKISLMECKSKIKDYWDCNAGLHMRFMSFFGEEHIIWREFLEEKIGNSGKVLELGCGTGSLTEVLADIGCDITAIDISTEMLKKMKIKSNCKNLLGDAETLPFKKECFDVLISRNLMCTLPHPGKALEEWFRVLKVDGELCIIDKIYSEGLDIRKKIGYIFATVLDSPTIWKMCYGKEIAELIPFHSGIALGRLEFLVEMAGFKEIVIDMMETVNSKRRNVVPFYYSLLQEDNFCLTAKKIEPE